MSAGAIGRWKHYQSHLAPLFQALGLPIEPKKAPGLSETEGVTTLVSEGIAAQI
jgi:hypothetical protein